MARQHNIFAEQKASGCLTWRWYLGSRMLSSQMSQVFIIGCLGPRHKNIQCRCSPLSDTKMFLRCFLFVFQYLTELKKKISRHIFKFLLINTSAWGWYNYFFSLPKLTVLIASPCLHTDLYTNKFDAVTGWFLSHLLGKGDVARGGVTEKVGSKAERDVRVIERRAYSRAGRHKDRPQSSEKSDFISFIANEASRYIPGSVLGSSGRSCATSHHSILCRASLCPFTFLLPCRSDALWCDPGQADLVRQACRKVLSCFF